MSLLPYSIILLQSNSLHSHHRIILGKERLKVIQMEMQVPGLFCIMTLLNKFKSTLRLHELEGRVARVSASDSYGTILSTAISAFQLLVTVSPLLGES